jgi:chromosome segregation ATPase
MYPKDRMAGMQTNHIRHNYPNEPTAVLDPKDERLIQLSAQNGYLEGRNSILEVDCQSLRQKNERLNERLAAEITDNKTNHAQRDDFQQKMYDNEAEIRRLNRIIDDWKEKYPVESKPDEGINLPPDQS